MKLYEQYDTPNRYSWILDAPYKMRNQLVPHGWKWIRGCGCKGSYVTNDYAVAKQLAGMYSLKIESNGTHKDQPLYEKTEYMREMNRVS